MVFMMITTVLFYTFFICLVGLEIYWLLRMVEFIWAGYIKRQIPFVASDNKLRMAVINEIKKDYPEYKTMCEIGSGYGGMARAVARGCGMRVTALENMPFTYFVARVLDFVSGARGVKTLRVDAFKWLGEYDGVFDIGLAYLGAGVNDRLIDYMHRFRVLFVLDVPMSNMVPVRVVDIGGGFTRYGDKKYPHKLFIYTK